LILSTKTIIMRTRIAIASIALATFVSISFYAYSDILESYSFVFVGDSEGFDCIPDLNISLKGVGKMTTSDNFTFTTSVTNPDFALPRQPHNFVINGVPLIQSGNLHYSPQNIGCFCCNGADVFCYKIGINANTHKIFIQVTHKPNLSCESTDPGNPGDN